MTIVTVTCDYCGTIHEVAPGFETLLCKRCGAAMKANFAYYPIQTVRAASIAAAPTYLHGVDLSYWQGAVNFAKLATKVNFAYLRCGYGNDSIDPRLLEYMRGCADNGIPFGLYWYMKPGKDFRKHADRFAEYSDFGDLPPVMDVEETGGLGKTALEGWLKKFVDRYEAAAKRQLAIYTSPGFWNANMPKTNWAKNRKLWVAHWTSAAQPTLPYEWTDINQPRTWTFWQYAVASVGAEYGVSSAKLDLNWYHGGAAEFEREFGVAPHIPGDVPPEPPPPEPPAEPEYPREVTLVGSFNLRQAPVIQAGNVITALPRGTKLKVIGEEGAWYVVSAYIHKDCDG